MSIIKCNSCNIVINELLAYIQNKISIIDEETLVRICTTSFSSDEIKNAKTLLFDSIPTDKVKTNRKNKGKEGRDLVDILNIFKLTEPDVIPIFVARELEKLPPILFDHLDCTKLLKDVLKIQNELNSIKCNYVTQDQLSECRTELLQFKKDSLPPISALNVNMRRGAWQLYDSGPVGLSHCSINKSQSNESLDVAHNSSRHGGVQEYRGVRVDRNINVNKRESAVSTKRSSVERRVEMTSPAAATGPCAVNIIPTETSFERHSAANTVREPPPCVSDNNDEGWKTMTKRKKPKYRYQGRSGISKDTEGSFKAAEKKVPIFISRIHLDTSNKDIIDYIHRKTKETITLEEVSFKTERGHKAFKFFVSECKSTMFLDSNLWPEGIVFRRFVNFRQRNTNGNYAVSANQNKYGT